MTTPKTKVMVIQDFYVSRNMISYILRQTGLRSIDTANDGSAALKKLKGSEYGMVISDWHMPVMDGLSLLKAIREDAGLKDLIFIMVTSESNRDNVLEAKECGVDAYVMKPFTAESLCRRIVETLQTRYPEIYKAARQQPGKPDPIKTSKPAGKIFGEAAAGARTSTPQSWSISLSHLSSRPQPVVKDNISAMMRIMSKQFDMMKEEDGFISIEDVIGKVNATIENAEQQAEHATLIADATNEIKQALTAVENVPGGSRESAQGLAVIKQSAGKLAEMVDSFDKEASDILRMLNGMEHMVRQAHIHEINDSIKASYELEMNPEAGTGRLEESSDTPGMIAGKLSMIQAESETAREALTMAAGGITHVIKRIKAIDIPVRPSLEVFHQLSSRIDRIMDILDSQATLTISLVTGVEDVAAVKKEVIESVEIKAAQPAKKMTEPGHPAVHEEGDGSRSALKKLINNRILMIDIIKSDHSLCLKEFEELLRDNADIELNQEQMPGSPACPLSKWIDRRLEHEDFHNPDVCRQIALLRDDMYVHTMQAFKLSRKGKKDEALKSYQGANAKSERIKELLKELQNDLRKKA